MKRILLPASALWWIGFAVSASHGQIAPTPPVVWDVAHGVRAPESVYFDRGSGFLFVSQIGGGGPAQKDGDGCVSQLTVDGQMVKAQWATGLDAPKGLRSHAGRLWVSDIDRLVGIDIATGRIAETVQVPAAAFLNDVACDADGAVYVSDTRAGRIHRYRDGRLSVFKEGEELESPNGLLVEGPQLIVAGWGRGLAPDFGTKTPGRLFALDLKTATKKLITSKPLGNLDGLESDGAGGYIVSDWSAGKLLHVRATGEARLILQLPPGTADLAYLPAKKLLIVPRMSENRVTAYDLSRRSQPTDR